MGRLEGKVALITGGARGMGEAHVRLFVAEGAKVVFGDLLDEEGNAVMAGLDPATARYVHQDITSPDDWASTVAMTLETFGRLDILVNNAGILRYGPIETMPVETFRQILDINVTGTWLGIKSVIAPMTEAGGGSIINISSVEGFTGAGGLAAYSASKFAIRGLTRSAAQELGQFGIRVNSVHPGGVVTPMMMSMVEHVDADTAMNFVRRMPLRRLGEAVEVSRLVAFLASDEGSYSTGAEFICDGGMISGPGY
jgi:3alpha(or 20beta)-hydroxysteroid dehydrogenase